MGDETVSSNGEPDTKEAEALAAALNHSAERVQTLWFSFLTFMLYLAVATGTTTHRMLFLEEPLNLPVLNIKLPLLGFYVLTPFIFVVFHFYMLLNLVLLARTARTFEDALERAVPDDGEARETFRMRIENTLFVQLLVGGRLEREGLNAKLLSLMALISLALAPVALLLMIQIKFLPYHSEWITWLHRSLLALDLALVWTLWPGYRSGWGVRLWPKATWKLALPVFLSTLTLVYAVAVATFPDEHMYLATHWVHRSTYLYPYTRDTPNWYALIAPVNTLVLGGEDLIDDAKLAHIIEKNEIEQHESATGAQRWVATLPLAGRDLTGANLDGADVRHVDFTSAILNRANLDFAWANEARFDYAQLRGALLIFSQLRGALLDSVQLQGASLIGAQLRGALLVSAQLQAASLYNAQLQGAFLDSAQLQNASLNYAQLQGASLVSAKLQGASLDEAQLQGASLGGAQLQGASFRNVLVWRADARKAVWEDTRVAGPNISPKRRCYEPGPPPPGYDKDDVCDWTVDTFEALKRLIGEQVPEGYTRRKAMERIEQNLDPTKALEGGVEMTQVWADHEHYSPALDVYEKNLAEQWRETGCAADGASYVLRGLLHLLDDPSASPFASDSPEKSKLAAAFLDKDCAGARGLSEASITKLKEIAAPAAPQAPKP